MAECCSTPDQRDLTGRTVKRFALWGLPLIAFVAGSFVGSFWHTLLWTAALTVAGTACIANDGPLWSLPLLSHRSLSSGRCGRDAHVRLGRAAARPRSLGLDWPRCSGGKLCLRLRPGVDLG